MSMPDRRAMIDPANDNLSVRRQCQLLQLTRSGVYRLGLPCPASASSSAAISMDGRGRFMDNIFIERLWRSVK